jgi:hypothetical protein
MAGIIDQPPPCRGQQPRIGVVRNARSRPRFECSTKSIAQGIFGPDLDRDARGAAIGPIEGGIQIRHVDNEEAAELFFRVGVRTVLYLPLIAGAAYGRGRLGHLETAACHCRRGMGEMASRNKRRPSPRIMGKIRSRNSSTRPCRINS